MNHQEVYNRVKTHLLQQNRQSLLEGDDVGRCAYRGENHTQCAIGCLIPDHLYDSSIEGVTISMRMYEVYADKTGKLLRILKNLGYTDYVFLEKLQRIHDLYQPHMWESELHKLAERYSLTP